jgi:hypothetical protein
VKLCAIFCFALCLCASSAHAQQSGRARSQASAAHDNKRSKPARKAKRSRAERKHPAAPARTAAPEAALPKPEAGGSAEAPAPAADEAKPTPEGDKPGDKAAAAQRADSEVGSADVHEEGGTEVKTMEFSGLDIEGQLKTPQMLYFLNRLRAEFGRPRLPHRSFMPELQAATQDKAMR